MNSALNIAKQEEVSRREATINEIEKLVRIMGDKIEASSPYDAILPSAHDAVQNQLAQHGLLMSYLNANHKDQLSWPLKTNKMVEILNGAAEVIKHMKDGGVEESTGGVQEISAGRDEVHYNTPPYDKLEKCLPTVVSHKTVLGFNPEADTNDVCTKFSLGNSALNFAQTAFLNILAIAQSANTFDELNLTEIYNPLTSPNIQTVGFPAGFNISMVDGLSNYFWYSNNSLVVPNLGYFFGGSRYDAIHANKEFKAEDCSAAVAKWSGYEKPLSTWHLRNSVNKTEAECAQDSDCVDIREKFIQKQEVEVGDVYVKGGHTGLISHIFDDGVLESISYNRDMPIKEGFGYNNVTNCDVEPKCLFFAIKDAAVCDADVCEGFNV